MSNSVYLGQLFPINYQLFRKIPNLFVIPDLCLHVTFENKANLLIHCITTEINTTTLNILETLSSIKPRLDHYLQQ